MNEYTVYRLYALDREVNDIVFMKYDLLTAHTHTTFEK